MNSKKYLTILILMPLLLCASCSNNNFSNWKENGSISKIKAYIDDVCNSKSQNYIPEEDRISTWDIDGTGILERNLNNNDLLPQDQIFEYTYQQYRKSDDSIKNAHDLFVAARSEYWKDEENVPNKVLFRMSQENYYNALIGGLTPEQASQYFLEAMKNGSYSTEKKLKDISYKPMKEMYSYLKEHKFQVYFLSGTFRYALYPLALETFGNIDFGHCIGTDFDTEYKIEEGSSKTTFTVMGDVCVNETKVKKIVTEIGKVPVISFGNSTGDKEMLQYTISGCKYRSLGVCINHDDDIREYKYAYDKVHSMCEEIGALEVSMKNDFLNIF